MIASDVQLLQTLRFLTRRNLLTVVSELRARAMSARVCKRWIAFSEPMSSEFLAIK